MSHLIKFFNEEYDLDNKDDYKKLRVRCDTLLSVYTSSAGLSKHELGLYIHTLKVYSEVLKKREYNDRLNQLNQYKEQLANRFDKNQIKTACDEYCNLFYGGDGNIADSDEDGNEFDDYNSQSSVRQNRLDPVLQSELISFLYKSSSENENEENLDKNQINEEGQKSKLKHGISIFGFDDVGGTDAVGEWNFTRLLSSRLRSAAELYEKLIQDKFNIAGEAAKEHIGNVNNGTNEFFSYFGAVYFVPRLLEKLANGIYHTGKDGDLDYLESNMNTVINDSTWITANTMGLFSSVAVAATFVGVGFYAIDFFNDLHKGYKKLKAIDDILEHLSATNISEGSKEQAKLVADMKQRLIKRKEYVKAETCVNAVVNTLFYCGSLAMLTNPLAGATVMVAASGVQYYLNNYYLPRKEVECTHDQLGLLAHRLLGHVEKQINRLKGDTSGKLNAYQEAHQHLKELLAENEDLDKVELRKCLDEVIAVSKRKRDPSSLTNPSSVKDLRAVLRPFSSGLINDGLNKSDYRAILKSIDNFENDHSMLTFNKLSFSDDQHNCKLLIEQLLVHVRKQHSYLINQHKRYGIHFSKADKYKEVYDQLSKLKNESTIDSAKLKSCLEKVIKASEMKKDLFHSWTDPSSIRDLREILEPFTDVLESNDINNMIKNYDKNHAILPKVEISLPTIFGPKNIRNGASSAAPEV
ncbi:MAG: hypothetical protein EP298_03785 [Gammaproteobacteria bacterium]|nr:MAG: hypothetical protein EP298_03785 [Gammaproteobacteria bacterium]UTW43751.1 hypothetical protein KFE69_06590 [bacterium SCSIO 12844]